MDAEGWLHAGDIGAWDSNGRLRLVDRTRDFFVISGGKTLSPSHIENVLRASPYVSDTLAIGDNRKYITALTEIEPETVAEWAQANGVEYAGFTSLASHPEVYRLVAAEVETANAQLARVEQIKAFRILPKVLDPEERDEPVTPTRSSGSKCSTGSKRSWQRCTTRRKRGELLQEWEVSWSAIPPHRRRDQAGAPRGDR